MMLPLVAGKEEAAHDEDEDRDEMELAEVDETAGWYPNPHGFDEQGKIVCRCVLCSNPY